MRDNADACSLRIFIILSVMVIGTIVSITQSTSRIEKSDNITDFTSVTLKTSKSTEKVEIPPQNPTTTTNPKKAKDFHPLANSLQDYPEKTTENELISNNL